MIFDDPRSAGRFLLAERLVAEVISGLARTHLRDAHVIRNASVIERYDRPMSDRVDLGVDGGVIESIESHRGRMDDSDIDGTGMIVVGGLVDSHVHTQFTSRQNLLHLLHGVTGVREMCGFPWMLDLRELDRSGEWLAPRTMIAGHILSTRPMDGFTTVVRTVVRQRLGRTPSRFTTVWILTSIWRPLTKLRGLAYLWSVIYRMTSVCLRRSEPVR